jgi:hypothetical protein
MARQVVPNYPYVQARNVGTNHRPTAVVVSLSDTTSEKGAALAIAKYHNSPGAPHKSYHYVVDENSIYRCVPLNVAAYGNPNRAISVHICAQPQESLSLWDNGSEARVLHKAATLVADLMLTYRIPARNLVGAAEEKWFNHRWRMRGGLIVRAKGVWPYTSFLDDIKAQMVIKQM